MLRVMQALLQSIVACGSKRLIKTFSPGGIS